MSAIVVLALPADRVRAEPIMDGFVMHGVSNATSVRLITVHPDDIGWAEAIQTAQNSRCVLFCWSSATAAPDAEPLRRLAARVLAAGHAISVELDPQALPAALAASTTYPLHGWRAADTRLRRFVFGTGFTTQIAAAAQEKLIGRDPPPPQAYWRLERRRAWVMIVGFAATIGFAASVLQFARDPDFAKWLDRDGRDALAAAKASAKPCEALRAFGKDHNGSSWSGDASELLGSCTMSDVIVHGPATIRLDFFAASVAEAQAAAQRACATHAANSGGALKTVQIASFTTRETGTAICILDQPRLERRETFGAAH